MNNRFQWALVLLSCLALTLGACGDDDGDGGNDAGNGDDSGNIDVIDLDVPDNDTSSMCGDIILDCERNVDCRNSDIQDAYGYVNPVCDSGCCVEGPCAQQDQACTPDGSQDTDEYFCEDVFGNGEGLCGLRCDSDAAEDAETDDCPNGAYCFEADPDFTAVPFANGACTTGDCDSIFNADDCGGVNTCLPVANGASFCIPAGDIAAGGECGADVTGDCERGLLCFEGECTATCDTTDSSACGSDECVAVFDGTGDNHPGICGTSCDAFSTGQCGEGESCQPALGRFGITAWYCADAPDTLVEIGETCVPEDNNCVEGAVCLNQGTTAAPIYECTEHCDASIATEPCTDAADVCLPSAIEGYGFCSEACTPYPRLGEGNYGCEEGNTCVPFATNDDPDLLQGACYDATGAGEQGDSCPVASNGFLSCADFGLCIDGSGAEPPSPTCKALCQPWTAGDTGCGEDEVCNAFADAAIARCETEFTDVPRGQACPAADEFLNCADDYTICIDVGLSPSGPVCLELCWDTVGCIGDPNEQCLAQSQGQWVFGIPHQGLCVPGQ